MADELLGSDPAVTVPCELSNLCPIQPTDIQPKGHPAAGPNIGGQVEAHWVEGDPLLVLPRCRLPAEGHNAVTVVVVEKVRKDLAANAKRCVLST
jgi:hypothetical protein